MKSKILRNPSRQNIVTIFRGREVTFRAKHSKKFDMEDEEQSALFFFLKETYEFLYELRGDTL